MNPNPNPDPDPDKMPTGVRRQSAPEKQAWQATNDDMEAIAEQRREEGWDVVTMPSLHVNPANRSDDPEEDSGFVFIIPNNHAEAFTEAYEGREFPEYLVYRREVKQSAFLVVEYIDPETETIIAVAGRYDLQHAKNTIPAIIEQQAVATALETIDGTRLGEFHHDDYEAFVPASDEDASESDGDRETEADSSTDTDADSSTGAE